MKRHGRRAVRPDVVIAKGRYNTVDEFAKSGREMDLLIECKVLPYDEWRRHIEEQIMPYREHFKPRNMILVSKHGVPRSVKEDLGRRGISVIDNVKPGDRAIEELKRQVRKTLK